MTLDARMVLELVPQRPPFRFLDRLLHIEANGAVGEYSFRGDEFFYSGHFPDEPVTPGVILLETMCQTGLVALGIYLLALESPLDRVASMRTLFSECEVEFSRIVRPGETVRVEAERVLWRRGKLRSRVRLVCADGVTAAAGTVSGVGRQVEGGVA